MTAKPTTKTWWTLLAAFAMASTLLAPVASADGEQPEPTERALLQAAESHIEDLTEVALTDLEQVSDYLLTPQPATSPTASTGENFESGATDWTMTSGSLWKLTTRIPGGTGTTSTNDWAWYGKMTGTTPNYNTGSTLPAGRNSGELKSPSFTIPSSGQLTFNSWYSTEDTALTYDQKWVKISINGGTPVDLCQLQFVNPTGKCYSAAGAVKTLTLSIASHPNTGVSWVGQSARLIFFFDTMDPYANDYEGWYLDNVKVTGASPPTNTAPNAAFTVDPQTGTTATTFTVDAGKPAPAGVSDAQDSQSNLQVQWDWTNDGVYDTVYSYTKVETHIYSTAGTYNIRMRVKDTGGLTSTTTRTITVNPTASPPNAFFTVTPDSGPVSTTFSVDASQSSDLQDSASALTVRWDWENDGTYDTSPTTTKTASHQYATTGSKTIKLEVTDSASMTGTYTRTVTVSSTPSIPQNAQASCANPHGVRVSWSAPASNGGSAITGYKVFGSLSANPASSPSNLVATPTAAQTFFDHVPTWTTSGWHYQVKATNANGDSDATAEVIKSPCDSLAPTAPTSMSSTSHASAASYYNNQYVTVTWSGASDAYSGLQGYSTLIAATGSTSSPDCVADVSSTTDTLLAPAAFGIFRFVVRSVDNAGNCGPTREVTVKVDAILPVIGTITGQGVTPDARQTIRVPYSDTDNGMDQQETFTKVDASSVLFFIDGVDKTAQASITSGSLTYTPNIAWAAAVHDFEIRIKDQAVGSTYLTHTWQMEYRPSAGGGSTGGGGGGGGSGLCTKGPTEALVSNTGGNCRDGYYANPTVDAQIQMVMAVKPIRDLLN